jgi:anti-sigma factor RsiW
MTRINPSKLVAYLDRELDGAEARSVERAVAADPALAARLRSLQGVDPTLKAAFDPVMTAPLPPLVMPPQLLQGEGSGRAGMPRAAGRAASWLALAAGVAGLVVGFAAGQMGPVLVPTDEPAVVAAITAELPEVLETEVSGTTVAFNDPIQGVSGTVKPVGTFKNADGSFCRAYEARASDDDATVTSRGIACRDQDGRWLTRVQVNAV